ncbi:hypothetical protein PGB90_010006 [Kerria lacca]
MSTEINLPSTLNETLTFPNFVANSFLPSPNLTSIGVFNKVEFSKKDSSLII